MLNAVNPLVRDDNNPLPNITIEHLNPEIGYITTDVVITFNVEGRSALLVNDINVPGAYHRIKMGKDAIVAHGEPVPSSEISVGLNNIHSVAVNSRENLLEVFKMYNEQNVKFQEVMRNKKLEFIANEAPVVMEHTPQGLIPHYIYSILIIENYDGNKVVCLDEGMIDHDIRIMDINPMGMMLSKEVIGVMKDNERTYNAGVKEDTELIYTVGSREELFEILRDLNL